MDSLAIYALFFLVWLYALHRSILYSGIDTRKYLRAPTMRWLWLFFWFSIGLILSGSALTLLTENPLYLILMYIGTLGESLVISRIHDELSQDEQNLCWSKKPHSNKPFEMADATSRSIVALEHLKISRLDQILYWGLAGWGIINGLMDNLLRALVLCCLALATAIVISQCQHLRYAVVTESELRIRYGIPPLRLLRMRLDSITRAQCHVKRNKIRLMIHDDQDYNFSLKLPLESEVAQVVLSHVQNQS